MIQEMIEFGGVAIARSEHIQNGAILFHSIPPTACEKSKQTVFMFTDAKHCQCQFNGQSANRQGSVLVPELIPAGRPSHSFLAPASAPRTLNWTTFEITGLPCVSLETAASFS